MGGKVHKPEADLNVVTCNKSLKWNGDPPIGASFHSPMRRIP